MEDLFRSYWWLLFPLSWFVVGGFQSWLSYRANRDTLDLLKSYAASGREPPPELLARLNKRWNEETDEEIGRTPRRFRRRYREEHPAYRAVLFGVLGAGFSYAAFADLYGSGEAFTIVAFVMGALCLASLVSLLVGRGPRI